MIEKLVSGNWVEVSESELVDGDTYRKTLGGGATVQGTYQQSEPTVIISDFIVKSGSTTVDKRGEIYWIPSRSKLEVTATITDTSGIISSILSNTGNSKSDLVIIAERIRGGDIGDVIDDIRFGVEIDDTTLTLTSNKGFDIGGNYVVTQERLNKGLLAIDAPFRIEMEKLEFDVLND